MFISVVLVRLNIDVLFASLLSCMFSKIHFP